MRLSKHPLAVARLSAQLPHLFRPVPYRGYLGLTGSYAAASTPYSVAMASQGHVDRAGRPPVLRHIGNLLTNRKTTEDEDKEEKTKKDHEMCLIIYFYDTAQRIFGSVSVYRLRLRTRFALRTRVRSHNLRRSAWTPGNSA